MIEAITLHVTAAFQELVPQYETMDPPDGVKRVVAAKDKSSLRFEFDDAVQPEDLSSIVDDICTAIDEHEVQ